ncbi:MAG: alpha amylase C-terminal domain-containing protein, partial [Bacteroidota bacterium]|nr:alpha amylase C-terminal domain-containing protein [Bacteroidota bacterium]
HFYNKDNTEGYDHRVLSYVRWSDNEKLIILSNFDEHKAYDFNFKVPPEVIASWGLENGEYSLTEELNRKMVTKMVVKNGGGEIQLELDPLESYIFKVSD